MIWNFKALCKDSFRTYLRARSIELYRERTGKGRLAANGSSHCMPAQKAGMQWVNRAARENLVTWECYLDGTQ
jgi:hypothetical protein